MISSILNIIGGLLSIAGQWMKDRANPKAIAAREQKNDVKKDDEFRDTLKNEDIEKTRTGLSG
jgi:hypothetical protein